MQILKKKTSKIDIGKMIKKNSQKMAFRLNDY